MVSLSLGLTKLAEHELFRREIRGNVLDVHFVVVNCCSMLLITLACKVSNNCLHIWNFKTQKWERFNINNITNIKMVLV